MSCLVVSFVLLGGRAKEIRPDSVAGPGGDVGRLGGASICRVREEVSQGNQPAECGRALFRVDFVQLLLCQTTDSRFALALACGRWVLSATFGPAVLPDDTDPLSQAMYFKAQRSSPETFW